MSSVTDFAGKRVVILGLARQGTALTRFFLDQGAQVTVSDLASREALAPFLAELDGLPVTVLLGDHPVDVLEGCDLVCLSGGVPLQIPIVREARRRGIALSNDALLTIGRSPAPAVGITGSSGKTTTTTLVGLMLAASGLAQPAAQGHRYPGAGLLPHVWVGGNIGTPLVDRMDQIAAQDWMVLELSSFQLELFDEAAGGQSLSPAVAAVLNITPNHLDRHPSMAHYSACKANILRWQGPDDVAVLGADDARTGPWLRTGQVRIEAGSGQPQGRFPLAGRRLGFGLAEPTGDGCWLHDGWIALRQAGLYRPVVPAGDVRLRGKHNLLNLAAACATAEAAGATAEAMAEVARTFQGVDHRLEVVRILNDVSWVNDSIATTPERAVAALRSFDEPTLLLAGGRDKKLPWQEFADLVHQRVKTLILFGEAAPLIASAVARSRVSSPLQVVRCADLEEAVNVAYRLAVPGDLVLLAPGGTSFDAYRDFEERGRHFRVLVRELPDGSADARSAGSVKLTAEGRA